MTTMHISDLFQKTMIATIVGLCISQSSIALEVLSDESLGDTTGEGIAFLPQDFYFMYRGAGANESKASLFSDRSKDTGYFHIIPVGPLTETALDTNKDGRVDNNDHSVGKADIYLYGLALSKTDKDINTRFPESEYLAAIRTWGHANNPWMIRVGTETNVPNFSANNCSGANDTNCQVSYLGLEAPRYEIGDRDPRDDAYQLKLGFWTDAFVLNQNKRPDASDLYHLGEKMNQSDANRANRLRLQFVWNGFSVNGSQVQVFQTLNGASNQNGMSTFYNNTMGIAALLRLNSGDSNLNNNYESFNNMRLSTTEISSSKTHHLETPAIQGGGAPVFLKHDDGFYLQNPNINLVLGSLYQPIIVGSDGKNFSLELARIPNKPEIYRKTYIDYDNPNSSTYTGSVCNVYKCGSNGSSKFQGTNATHSSITVGTTHYDSSRNTLRADNYANSKGISRIVPWYGGRPNPYSTNLGTVVIDGILIQHLKITSKGL